MGCGAVSQRFYVPALSHLLSTGSIEVRLHDPTPTALVTTAALLGLDLETCAARDYRDALKSAEAVIIATPNASHASIATDCIDAHIPTLVEKPLAPSLAEAAALVARALQLRVPLLVNHTRRLFGNMRELRRQIASRAWGDVVGFRLVEAGDFTWPTTSGFYFKERRGVLLDRGPHAFDLIMWLLGGDFDVLHHQDDSLGGPEATSVTTLRTSSGIAGEITLSWLGLPASTLQIRTTEAQIDVPTQAWNSYKVDRQERRLRGDYRKYADFSHDVLAQLLESVRTGEESTMLPASIALPSLRSIDDCYNRRAPLELPWM